jgi:PAS domain S-box-containing protein
VRKDDSGRSGYDGRLEVAASRPGISECEQAAEVQPTTKDVLEAREILESVLDNSTQYSLIGKDLDRRITVWNKGAARIYGYEASEVIGRSSDILHVPEEIRSGVIEELHQRAQAEGLAAGLFRRRRKDGSEFLARLTVTTRKDAQGNAKGYFVFSHDVTAEQRYVEEQRFLARVGETLQISLDYATTIEGIARLTIGFLGDGCAIDVLEEAGKLDRKKVVHADAAKAGLAEALQHILPERGHPIWKVLETKQPLLFSEVSADLLRSIANDDEHLRLLEAIGIESVMLVPLVARDRLLAVLSTVWCRPGFRYRPEDVGVAQEFARRAALALDNALLYDLAQTAIRTREQILGFVAHDLRNPLGTIVSSAALLRRLSADAGGSRRPVDAIERAAIRMKRLIQDLLDVARMEGGFLPIEPGVVETRQAIADCIDAHQDLAASAFLALESDVSADVPDVWADRDRLLQVFENLIGNAVKFTAQSGSIVIGARSQDRAVQFWVRDSGMGIAEEDLPQLFDRFWQADNVRRRGTGLGLPIVKGIVEAHGGRIWVESVKGRGSTFFFTIPTAAHASANLP